MNNQLKSLFYILIKNKKIVYQIGVVIIYCYFASLNNYDSTSKQ